MKCTSNQKPLGRTFTTVSDALSHFGTSNAKVTTPHHPGGLPLAVEFHRSGFIVKSYV